MILKKTIINNLEDIKKKLIDKSLINEKIILQIEKDYSELKDLEIKNDIFIPFLGSKDVGKSTILNGIIGEDIFPIDKPTQKVFIINNADPNEEINIRKVKLIKRHKEENQIDYYFDFNNDYIIAKGLEKVKETIKGLNYKFIDKLADKYLENPENYFYLIRTKIKLFDNLKEKDENIKQRIYLIDFPGFENRNDLQTFIESNILKICNSFVFVFRESFIDEANYRYYLWNIFNQAKEIKQKINYGFIEKCLFILNLDKSNEKISNDLLDSYINNIKSVIKAPENKSINIFTFNAKSFVSEIKKYNYFFQINDTINSAFKTFCKVQNFIFKNPEVYNKWEIKLKGNKITNSYKKNYYEFQKYITNRKKMKEMLEKYFWDEKSEGSYETNENVIKITEDTLKNLELPLYDIKIKFSPENKKALDQFFSFAQSKLNFNSILIKNNYSLLEKRIIDLLKLDNLEIYSKFKLNTDNINKRLKIIFENSGKQKENNYNNFKNTIENLIKEKINPFIEEQIRQTNEKKEICLIKIRKILESKQKAIFDGILKETKENIKNDILRDIMLEMKELNSHLENLFNNINGSGNSYFIDIKTKLLNFINSKKEITEFEDIHNFKDYFYSIILNENNIKTERNVIEEISNEIQMYFKDSISKIFDEKGFLEFFKSFFSRDSHLLNLIEIIDKYISDRITFIIKLLTDNLSKFTTDKIDLIKLRINLFAVNNTADEIKIVEELRKEWEKILESNNSCINNYNSLI